jgi:hypothetical protein
MKYSVQVWRIEIFTVTTVSRTGISFLENLYFLIKKWIPNAAKLNFSKQVGASSTSNFRRKYLTKTFSKRRVTIKKFTFLLGNLWMSYKLQYVLYGTRLQRFGAFFEKNSVKLRRPVHGTPLAAACEKPP